MWFKIFLTVFTTVFLAEIGDKTQLATMLFSAENADQKWAVFAGSAVALVLAAAIGVMAGAVISRAVSEQVLRYVAGTGFIAVGLWTILRG